MADLLRMVYPHSGHPLAEGRAQDRVSSPAKDWRSANCATQPNMYQSVCMYSLKYVSNHSYNCHYNYYTNKSDAYSSTFYSTYQQNTSLGDYRNNALGFAVCSRINITIILCNQMATQPTDNPTPPNPDPYSSCAKLH